MIKINVLLIGGGGREYAIAWKISQSSILNNLYSISSSDPINLHFKATELAKSWSNFDQVADLCFQNNINLVVIGPEEPIVAGLSDFLRAKNILVFSPSQEGAKIESSKDFTKKICVEKRIPTASYTIFTNINDLNDFLNKNEKFPIVLKYDGLAGGKGVKISNNRIDSLSDAADLYSKYSDNFKIITEEFLNGYEISFFAVTDLITVKKITIAQDYKRAFDCDIGPNTGGMGVICGDFLINQILENKIMNKIINPLVEYLQENSILYNGIIFAGLMIVNNEPYLLEFNARFGDPETEAMMLLMNCDILDLFYKVATNELNQFKISILQKKSICVVIASAGYPESYEKNILIDSNLDFNSDNTVIFYHGISIINDKFYSNGGRVLSVNVVGESIDEIRKIAYAIIKKINWNQGFYRSDIGKNVPDTVYY